MSHALLPSRQTIEAGRRRRRVFAAVAAATAAVLSIAGIVSVASPALATEGLTGEVSGAIELRTDLGDTEPVEDSGALITAYLLDDTGDLPTATVEGQPVESGASGSYSFGELPVGSYAFLVDYRGAEPNRLDGFIGSGAVDINEALQDPVTSFFPIGEEEVYNLGTHIIEFGSLITGTLTRQGSPGTKLATQPVTLYRLTTADDGSQSLAEFGVNETDVTGIDGTYAFGSLPGGTYTLHFGDGTQNYVPEYWNDRVNIRVDDADTFTLSPTFPVEEVVKDAALDLGSRITGSVKNTSNAGLPGIAVTAYSYDSGSDEFVAVGAAAAGGGGAYTLQGLAPGTYRIGFAGSSNSIGYVGEFYDDVATVLDADDLPLGAAETLPGVNATLAKGGSISGVISLQGGGHPAASEIGIHACLEDGFYDCTSNEGNIGLASYTSATGAYKVDGLSNGSYVIYVAYSGSGDFLSSYYGGGRERDDDDTVAITVGSAANVTAKNIQLSQSGRISGHVTVSASPVAGVKIAVYPYLPFGNYYDDIDPLRFAFTNALGDYTVRGLPTGEYVTRAEPSEASGLAWKWGGDTYSLAEASHTQVTAPDAVSGVDFTLEAGGTFTLTVNEPAPSNAPIAAFAILYRFQVSGGSQFDHQGTYYTNDDDGIITFSNLPPGDYGIYAGNETHAGSWYGAGAGGINDATRIHVVSGANPTLAMTFDRLGSYTGRVVDSEGTPLVNAFVLVDDDSSYGNGYTDSDGYFLIDGLKEGPHEIEVSPDEFDTQYASSQKYDVAPTTINAEPVDVGDLVVEFGATLTGQLIGIDGKPLKNFTIGAWVDLDSDSESVAQADSSTNGRFTLSGLPTDIVYLQFSPPDGSSYGYQWLGGAPEPSLSDPISITVPGSTTYREIRLLSGSTVTGVVKNKTTGRVLKGIGVTAFPTEQQSYRGGGYTETNSKGTYAIPGLEGGSYQVSFNGYTSGNGFDADYQTAWIPEKTTVKINSSLAPAAKVSGTVTDDLGAPVPDIDITATRADGGHQVATSDDDGKYTLYLSAGSWTLEFVDRTRAHVSTYLGGSPSPPGSTKVVTTTSATAQSGKNAVLVRSGGGTILATVIGDDEVDPTGSVELQRLDGPAGDPISSQTVYTGPDAQVHDLSKAFPWANVVPGTYRLVIDGISRSGGDSDYGTNEPAYYAEYTSAPFEVLEGQNTDLGELGLGPVAGYDDFFTVATPPEVLSDGSPQVGESISVTDGLWKPAADTPAITYQWRRDGVKIGGATGAVYQLAPGDAGRSITVAVTAAQANTVIAKVDLPIAKGGGAIPITPPTISGAANAGKTLTVSAGEWDLPGLTTSYGWFRDGVAITGATAASYKLATVDVGKSIEARVTVRRAGFETTTYPVSASAILPALAVKLTKAGAVTTTIDGFATAPGTWSPSMPSLSYSWLRYDAATGSATEIGTGPSVVDQAAHDSTDRITVRVTASKAGYGSTTVEIPVRSGIAPVFGVAPSAFTAGTSYPGVPISVDLTAATTVPAAGVTVKYQWYKGTTAIVKATGVTYTPATTDVGSSLTVRISLTAAGHAAAPPANTIVVGPVSVSPASITTDAVTVSGSPWVGRTLTAVRGDWNPASTAFSYVWMRDGVSISKATKSAYLLVASDLGKGITVTVTGKFGGQTATETSLPVSVTAHEPVSVTAPSIGATSQVGVKLTATSGTWDVKPTSVRYQWYDDGVALPGAIAATFTPIRTQVGHDLSVGVVAVGAGGESMEALTSPVTVEVGAAIKSTKAPALTIGGKSVKSVKLNQTIAATAGTWPVSALQLTYQWQVLRPADVWTDLAGEDRQTLFLDADNLDPLIAEQFQSGFSYRVVVSASRVGYLDGPPATSSLLKVP